MNPHVGWNHRQAVWLVGGVDISVMFRKRGSRFPPALPDDDGISPRDADEMHPCACTICVLRELFSECQCTSRGFRNSKEGT